MTDPDSGLDLRQTYLETKCYSRKLVSIPSTSEVSGSLNRNDTSSRAFNVSATLFYMLKPL